MITAVETNGFARFRNMGKSLNLLGYREISVQYLSFMG